ncbi:alpha/beta hydrolase [Paenibacillus sinopodophylli]|uniref:alpha/beta hydrolase n=1 Tax=Paenibacillus sinopodophylli TaxID=1837342 RepID=UPI0014864E4F|nr:alpha/beta hydrolase [Paenibacillus sinopodophylli]
MTKEVRVASSMQMKYVIEAIEKMSGEAGLNAQSDNAKLDVIAIREMLERSHAHQKTAPGTTYADADICPVHMEVVFPEKLETDNIIFYMHGGSFISGSAKHSRGFASVLAAEVGCRVFTIDYRLAPEHPFPAGVDDCFTAYQALLMEYPGTKISLIGDSAGAMAALVTTLRAMRAGIQLPSSVIIHSPGATLVDIGRENYDTHDLLVGKNIASVLKGVLYDESIDLENPDLSPLYGDYRGFPPVFMTSDANETFSIDAQLLYDKLTEAGVEITWVSVEGAFHAFGTVGRGTPESAQLLDEAEAFIKKHFAS